MRFTLLLLLAVVWSARADTILFTSGKTATARVLAYANGTFEVEDEKRNTVRIAAGTIQRIEFAEVSGALDTRAQGKITGTVRRYDKAAFEYKDAAGNDRTIPALMVNTASFGAGGAPAGNVKPVEQVSGDLEKHIVPGKVTIVDFYADWCGPCRRLMPQLEDLVKNDPTVVLRKVNVDKNQRLASQFGVRGIPHIVVFDKTGKNFGTLTGANIESVKNLVNKAKAKAS